MIDPLTVVINHLEADSALATLTNNQIASLHKFALPQAGRAWSVSAGVGALQVRYAAGGQQDWDSPVQTVRLEARCYGSSEDEAGAVWREMVRVSRETVRTSVSTTDGTGLLYWLLLDGSPRFDMDPDVRVHMVVQYLQAQVHEDSLT